MRNFRSKWFRNEKTVRFAVDVDIFELPRLESTFEDTAKATPPSCYRQPQQQIGSQSLVTERRNRRYMETDDDEESSILYLLNKLKRTSEQTHNVIEAVMEEQINQWENNEYDPERLAKASMAQSAHSQIIARLKGMIDRIVIEERDSCTRKHQMYEITGTMASSVSSTALES